MFGFLILATGKGPVFLEISIGLSAQYRNISKKLSINNDCLFENKNRFARIWHRIARNRNIYCT